MQRLLLVSCVSFFTACAVPHARPAVPASPQGVLEQQAERPHSYLSFGGGLTQQRTDSNATADIDTDSVNARVSGGYRPEEWLDISLGNDFFVNSTSTGSVRVSSVANNLGVSANILFNPGEQTEFYGGPNLGLYLARVKGGGLRQSSTEPSIGFQLGLRHWLDATSAIRVEWRNIFAEQDGLGGGSNDVRQSTLIVSYDISF